MRVTISHDKGKKEAMRIIDQTADEFIKGMATGPVKVTNQSKSWNGSTMDFGFTGKMGIFSSPIKGKIDVTETEVIIDVELPGMLKNFLPEEKVRAEVQNRVRGLLA